MRNDETLTRNERSRLYHLDHGGMEWDWKTRAGWNGIGRPGRDGMGLGDQGGMEWDWERGRDGMGLETGVGRNGIGAGGGTEWDRVEGGMEWDWG